MSALDSTRPVFGVKGPTPLSRMMLDIVRGTAVDVMHCVYLGVVKKITELWLDSSLQHEPFSLYAHRQAIDQRLVAIKPPNFIKRLPRSLLKDAKHFKASEWMSWFFYYSIFILDGYMDPEYYQHSLKLVFGVFILNESSIFLQSIQLSFQLLTAFVSQFQSLYGVRYMSFNMHSLRHLPDLVCDLGPLWVTSCFPFEDLLGTMVKFVQGTRYVGLQVYSKVAQSLIVANLISNLDDDQSEIKKFCTRLNTIGKRIAADREIAAKIFVLGKLKRRNKCIFISTIAQRESNHFHSAPRKKYFS